jgi:predicted alpha-1,6-mannanase (GH76 family)
VPTLPPVPPVPPLPLAPPVPPVPLVPPVPEAPPVIVTPPVPPEPLAPPLATMPPVPPLALVPPLPLMSVVPPVPTSVVPPDPAAALSTTCTGASSSPVAHEDAIGTAPTTNKTPTERNAVLTPDFRGWAPRPSPSATRACFGDCTGFQSATTALLSTSRHCWRRAPFQRRFSMSHFPAQRPYRRGPAVSAGASTENRVMQARIVSLLLFVSMGAFVACSTSEDASPEALPSADASTAADTATGDTAAPADASTVDVSVGEAAVASDSPVASDAPVVSEAAAPQDSSKPDAPGSTDAPAQSDGSADAGEAGAPANAAADIAYDAFTKMFYTVTGGKGYYLNNAGDTKADGFWGQAELIEMAIDAYDRKKSDAYKTLVTELVYGFVAKQGTDWSGNKFNDDIAWMVIASTRAHLDTGNADFLTYAKSNWDKMYARAWDTTFAGGGLWWTTDNNTKNACINGPGAIGAYLLYKATGDNAYLTKAKAIYAWERATLFDATNGSIQDRIELANGLQRGSLTYNQGTFIGAANYLLKETGTPAYFDDAKKASDFLKNGLCDAEGLPRENQITGDFANFKAIGFRWVAKFMVDNNLGSTYLPWLQYNANKAWANRRATDNISWND